MAERHSLRANALSMVFGQGATWLLTAVTLALLPRYLGPEHMGQLGVGLTFGSLGATIAGLGMQTLITRDVARDREAGRALLATAFWLNILLGTVAGVASMAVAWALGYGRGTQAAVAVNALTIPFNLVTLVGFSALQGLEVMRYQAVYDAGNKVLFLAGTVAIIVLDLGFGAYLLLSAVSAVGVAVPALLLTHQHLPFRARSFSRLQGRYLVVQSLPFWSVGLFLVVYLGVDVFMLSLLSGETAVGIYTAPSRIFGTLLFGPTIVTTVVFPRMAAAFKDAPDALQRLARSSLELVVGITLPVAVLAVGVADRGLVWLIGHGFADSGPVVVVLALSLVPTSINMVAHRILIAVDRQGWWTLVMLAGLVAKVALCMVMIPAFDARFDSPALGAAASLVVVESGMTLAALVLMPRGYFGRSSALLYAKLALAAAVTAEVMYFVAPAGFVATGAAGAVVYATVVLFLGAYQAQTLWRSLRWTVGRKAAGLSFVAAPERAHPLLFEPRRMKDIRAARTSRGR